jgi:hypothetical protein
VAAAETAVLETVDASCWCRWHNGNGRNGNGAAGVNPYLGPLASGEVLRVPLPLRSPITLSRLRPCVPIFSTLRSAARRSLCFRSLAFLTFPHVKLTEGNEVMGEVKGGWELREVIRLLCGLFSLRFLPRRNTRQCLATTAVPPPSSSCWITSTTTVSTIY